MIGRMADHPLTLLVVVLVIVLIFGAKRLPDASRSLARSMRIFKSEVREMKDEDRRSPGTSAPGTPASPLEGRVVDDQRTGSTSASSTSEQHRHNA